MKPIDKGEDPTTQGATTNSEGIESEDELEFVLGLVDFPDYSAIYQECN